MEKIRRIGKKLFEWGKTLIKKNKYFGSIFLLQIFTISVLFLHRIFHPIYLSDTDFSYKAPLKKACYMALKSILDRRVSSILFDKGLIKQMVEGEYQIFDFVGEEKIYDIMQKEKNRCVGVFTDRKGTRYFSFQFKESEKWRHVYGQYIVQIDEVLSQELNK